MVSYRQLGPKFEQRSMTSVIASGQLRNGSTPRRNGPITILMRNRRNLLALCLMSALLPLSAHSAHAVVSGVQVDMGTMLSPPANLSTSGDFATDTFGDPWDFSNPEDVIPIDNVGVGSAHVVSLANGQLTVAMQGGSELRVPVELTFG